VLRTEVIAPVGALLKRHAAERPDKPAFRDRERAVTYGALACRTAALAGHLAGLGLAPGDRVAIWLPNGVTWIESCLATLRAGAVVVPISHDASDAEALYRLTDAGCRIVITTAARAPLLATERGALSPALTEILVDGASAR
jgi:rifamycin polyketide synthase module 1/2/3